MLIILWVPFRLISLKSKLWIQLIWIWKAILLKRIWKITVLQRQKIKLIKKIYFLKELKIKVKFRINTKILRISYIKSKHTIISDWREIFKLNHNHQSKTILINKIFKNRITNLVWCTKIKTLNNMSHHAIT